MFKDLRYYEKLSQQLGEEIEILEKSYENYTSALELTEGNAERQKRVKNKFRRFCQDEGFYQEGVTASDETIKDAYDKRVEFLKEQKANIDEMVRLHTELEALKNGELGEETVNRLKAEAAKKYTAGTKKYNDHLSLLKREAIEKHDETVRESISTAKEKISKSKKENNLLSVVGSAFGPIGNKIYNLYAGAHNINTDIRKHRVFNLLIKGILIGGSVVACSYMSLTGLPLAASVIGLGYAAVRTVVNSFRPVPKKIPYKNEVTSLKESWFRYRKSRGKGSLSIDKELYNELNFDRLRAARAGERTEGDTPEHEMDPEHEREHDDDLRRTPEAPSDTPEVPEAPETPIESPESPEAPTETPEAPVEAPEDPVFEPLTSAVDIDSLEDAKQLYERLQQNGGCKTMYDWQSLENAQRYLTGEYMGLRTVGSGLWDLTEEEKAYNRKYDEVVDLNNKFNEIGKSKREVMNSLNRKLSLSSKEVIEINSVDEAIELQRSLTAAGGIKTKEDFLNCRNAYNYLNSFMAANPDRVDEVEGLAQIFKSRISSIGSRYDENGLTNDRSANLNTLYQKIRFDLNEDGFISRSADRRLTEEQRRELLQKYNKQRDDLISACQNRYNEIVGMFDTCDDYNEMFATCSDFIARAGKTISEDQKRQLIFLLSSKKDQFEASREESRMR